ncbi:hypothetical protein B0H10DRAFT_511216 [Mycena sp. CBHHK59/15]|nr:hypothetical protein B0H10DRAFT_511216 [Mycena sp. CBHHK59/15]
MSMFHELDEDILLGVLSNCDVHAVLCVSRVSKLLRSIAMSKPLWLSLLADLASRSLMDAFQYSEITNCSTAELIQMVKRLVTGPETWSRRTVTPAVWREISVKPTSIRGGTNPTEYNIRLLPGGRHVMVEHHTGRFECWSVKTGSLVWTGALGTIPSRFRTAATLPCSFSCTMKRRSSRSCTSTCAWGIPTCSSGCRTASTSDSPKPRSCSVIFLACICACPTPPWCCS